jgi:hypothetical protein
MRAGDGLTGGAAINEVRSQRAYVERTGLGYVFAACSRSAFRRMR